MGTTLTWDREGPDDWLDATDRFHLFRRFPGGPWVVADWARLAGMEFVELEQGKRWCEDRVAEEAGVAPAGVAAPQPAEPGMTPFDELEGE